MEKGTKDYHHFKIRNNCVWLLLRILTILASFPLVCCGDCCEREITEVYVNNKTVKLEDFLPEDTGQYSILEPPKKDGKVAVVEVNFAVEAIEKIDEASMTMTCLVYLFMKWKDPNLRPPQNITKYPVKLPTEWLDEIWKPDVFIKNVREIKFHTMPTGIPYHLLWLKEDNELTYGVKMTLELSCPMDFRKYPHDYQGCQIVLESFDNTQDDLVLLWASRSFGFHFNSAVQGELPQLMLLSYITDYCNYKRRGSETVYNCLKATMKFRRRLGHVLFHIYLPTIIIVMVSWLSFWMSPEDVTERVMLGITSLLTIFAQHSISGEFIPPVSYLTAVDVFMLMCTIFVFLSIVEFIIVYLLAKKSKKPVKEDQQDNDIDHDAQNNFQLQKRSTSTIIKDNNEQDYVKQYRAKWYKIAKNLDRISRYAAPTTFLILNGIYWIVYEVI